MTEPVVVVDYGAGNLASVANALRAAGAEALVTANPRVIARAGRIVLPGVGAFAQCIGALRGTAGVLDALTTAVRTRGVPFLGVCVGMQLLASEGHEHGVHPGLGWIGGTVERLTPAAEPGSSALKVPHMGWNTVTRCRDHAALANLADGASAYFVHSYRFAVADRADVVATTGHGEEIVAIAGRDNILGVQFHPEKSQAFGLAFLASFLAWRP